MNKFQEKVLNYLKINENDLPSLFKDVSYDDIENPNNFLNIDKAVIRIKKAIENHEKIMIYGDYDCDGISATSIMVKMFSYLNVKVGYYIPSRYLDGYGINLNRAEEILKKGYNLVITVDNGVAAYEPIKFLTDKGIDVILTDHHEITRELPPCYTIVHPDLKIDDNLLKQCGAYVAFMLSIKLLNRIDDYLLVLAMQATISDMMPLISYNRDLVKLGLKIINQHIEYPQRRLSMDTIIDEDSFGFQICPKINAFGRIREDTSVNDMVLFFVTDDKKRQDYLVKEIESVNEERKKLLNFAIKKIDFSLYENCNIIVERFDNISEGVIGLVASKILNEINKPTIVFTKVHNENVLKGSARSINGFSLSEAFENLKDILLVYGGHEEAGGLSIDEDNYELFKSNINLLCNKIEVSQCDYISLDKEDVNFDNYQFLKSLSPFGMDFKKPVFYLEIENKNIYFIGKEKKHIKGYLSSKASFIGFSCADMINGNMIKTIGNINYDSFKKQDNVVYQISKII